MRTEFCAQWPPTKPSMVPSANRIASSPGRADVGCWARTTVARTNGVRAATSCAARSLMDIDALELP
ncbi:Uncharacterised protein [Mycobacterium tuberculosis]|uniref:Uncharacterized protein n=1 Tax=Mycobacterium tuberculosis TaxID=1773 RepID=A0A0U0RVV6_MYCTX|nr:Uncharacterised protein [Mycobacterium tuberculosis]